MYFSKINILNYIYFWSLHNAPWVTNQGKTVIIVDEGTLVDVVDEDDNTIPLSLDYEDDEHLKSSTQIISIISNQIRQIQLRDEK